MITVFRRKLFAGAGDERGAVAVELALVFFPLMFMIFLLFELCRVTYISSALNLATAEASRYAAVAKISDKDYERIFREKLQNDVPLWPSLTKDTNLTISVKYCDTLNDIITDNCDSQSYEQKPLAVYHVGYAYSSIVPFVPDLITESYLQRTTIYVQEYQRNKT
ncbi:pilus assembly protein [Citrobacter rodentium NBRC 105723 = DSM 16636]|uniref:TadE/TadG family type IV pilus assembly protein n=1 Tax=Citrobacter rodentium TaxID=67825 RepID=UPI001E52A75F|nr:TadE family protein [Citrobacter rodentium]UHO32184.1 pilus assembly protein [Citrobacter rodentium NBRC 105723 = DSM 16636]